jgi:hypothetical protein
VCRCGAAHSGLELIRRQIAQLPELGVACVSTLRTPFFGAGLSLTIGREHRSDHPTGDRQRTT